MAKKESEISVEERLKTLYQLQTTLSAIDEKRALRGELPLEVQDLEDEIAGLKTRVEHIEGDIADFQQAVAQKQGEIAEAEESVERYKKLCNKKIKEANVKVEDKKRELAHTNDLIADRQQALAEKRNELEEIMQETREEEEVLKAKAADLETKIEPRLLSSFLRIRKNARNGLGIVYVQRDACGGCFNKIPPQRQLDIKMHKKIIVCEYCGRIMIDPELAGVKTATPEATEEKPKRKRATTRKTASKKSEESETKLS